MTDEKDSNKMNESIIVENPWFIHHQSKQLVLYGKHAVLELLQQKDEFETFLCLVNQYGGTKKIAGAPKVFSALYKLLQDDVKSKLLPLINAYDFLEQDRGGIKEKQRQFEIEQRKNTIINHLSNSQQKKIILVKMASLLDDEIYDGIWQYIEKHGKHVCAIATTEDEITKIAKDKPLASMSLIIISHWEPHWEHFSVWSKGVYKIGASIGSLLNNLPQISALRLIACNTGQLVQPVSDIPIAIKNPQSPIYRTLTFIREYNDLGLPFTEHSLARQIWDNTVKQQREFSLSASPAYMLFFNKKFVGSEHCIEHQDPSFSDPSDFNSSKTICITTPQGPKALSIQNALASPSR